MLELWSEKLLSSVSLEKKGVGFMVYGYMDSNGAFSVDGINWTKITGASSVRWVSIAYGNKRFCIKAEANSISAITTNNGASFSKKSTGLQKWNSSGLGYGNGKFVCVMSDACGYSTDGLNWTNSTLSVTANWKSIKYDMNKFVVVGESSTMLYSLDGITWTTSTLPSNSSWQGVTSNGKLFVTVGNNAVAYSYDGVNWTKGTIPSGVYTGVTYGNKTFIAVGTNVCAYSKDGINWTKGTMLSGSWRDVAYGNKTFVAVGTNICAYSKDGINWTASSFPVTFKDGPRMICYGVE